MFEFLKKRKLFAPVDGKVIAIEDVQDPVFAKKMIGDGFGVISTGSHIYACGDGKISMIYPSGHAVGMQLSEGLEVLLHIGIDTVNEEGKGFKVLVEEGADVKAGDCLVEIDREYLLSKGYDLTVIVIFTDKTSYRDFKIEENKNVKGGKDKVAAYW